MPALDLTVRRAGRKMEKIAAMEDVFPMTLYRRIVLGGVLLLAVSSLAQQEVKFVPSPSTSLSKTRQLLDAADLRIMLPLGYSQEQGGNAVFAGRAGVVEQRDYLRARSSGQRDWISLAIVAGVGGGYDFALAGETWQDERSEINADLGDVERQLQSLLKSKGSSAARKPDMAYEMYRLGHIEADRALALIKAMGYTTIEFVESSKAKGSEKIFDEIKGKTDKLPFIIKVVNAAKTSLMQPDASSKKTSSSSSKSKGVAGAPKLGGEHLHSTTAGAPQERLLLVYDRNEPEALERLINLLQAQVDVPAQQIVIEALIVEINTSHVQDLGVELSGSRGSASGRFGPSETSGRSIGSFIFSRDTFTNFTNFRAKLEALEESGDAEVLSSPSVLVLNDRQARIQVGRQIPVSRTTSTTAAVTKGIEYFPIGIVLNLRPRINTEGTEVTMQIETIISSISPESAARLEGADSGVEFSPIVDNRLVETYVRVADGTPFIIGGLLSTNEQGSKIGLPFVSNIPYLGRLFSRERVEKEWREVIVVITPHIVPLEDHSFSYLIPKDSDIFDRFDFKLFRNAYRVRDNDVWDLQFIRQSPVLQDLVKRLQYHAQEDVMLQRQEPFSTLLDGNIPGEQVLVRCMLSDIVDILGFYEEIDLEKVFFFEDLGGEGRGNDFDDADLSQILLDIQAAPERAVLLTYKAQPQPDGDSPFSYPVATLRDTLVPTEERAFMRFLREVNPDDPDSGPLEWTIVLANDNDVRQLRKVLILKRVLELNSKLPLTLEAFRPGLQILFPTREDMRNRYHLIDGDVAALFYETSPNQYYPAFERIFNRTLNQIEAALGDR
jgi:general secretion pathway protein D